jgi:hypothetical protein
MKIGHEYDCEVEITIEQAIDSLYDYHAAEDIPLISLPSICAIEPDKTGFKVAVLVHEFGENIPAHEGVQPIGYLPNFFASEQDARRFVFDELIGGVEVMLKQYTSKNK